VKNVGLRIAWLQRTALAFCACREMDVVALMLVDIWSGLGGVCRSGKVSVSATK